MPGNKIKVIVVDDSASIRGLFSMILNSDPLIEVVATAEDPYDAREKIKKYNPDLITLDVEMPKMDGISFLEKIMTLRPMPVLMASTLTTRGADTTLRALEIGAVDYIAKPQFMEGSGLDIFKEELLRKVKQAARIRPAVRPPSYNKTAALPFMGTNTSQLIAIGASTGGVEAIRDILIYLPHNTPAVVITQHMPEVFTASFARRMNDLSEMAVHEAVHGQLIEPGNVYIAAGNKHLEIRQTGSQLSCALTNGPIVSGHRPSVDVLFDSVSQIKNRKIVAIILTGMGHDGAAGLRKIKDAGFYTLGQSEASCVVYGMPKAAKQLGGVAREVSLSNLPKEILQFCST